MQRGAATPSSTPSTPSEPPSKRQRLSNGTAHSTPSSTPRSRVDAIDSVPSSGNQTPLENDERGGPDHGESKWYLSVKEPVSTSGKSSLHIVSAGYSTLDGAATSVTRSSEEEEADGPTTAPISGRRSFGKFNRKIEVRSLTR